MALSSRCVRRADSRDATQVYGLRHEAFTRADEFVLLEPETLAWSQHDDSAAVLVACDADGELVSTMRGEVLLDADEAEARMECRVPLPPSNFPALLLGKAATRPRDGCAGVHSVLRYHFLDAAIAADLASLLGVVFEGAPRTRLIESLGYVLVSASEWWYTDVAPRRQTLLAHLDGSRMKDALATLGARAEPALAAFPWQGSPLSLGP